ncbi:putative sarcosine oxidase [Xylariales sp. PMI_506]|nr:putative sarcosine oxidase [Xylariales sp. PMI_506]
MAGIEAPEKHEPIVIVGSGIFGLSTALHLARRGYRNVTVFDKQPYDETLYSYLKGADAASADMNKIVRSAYGAQREYQDLSTEAIAGWHAWNQELARETTAVPPGMTKQDAVFVSNGNISLSSEAALPEWELACIRGMEEAGHPDTQLATTDSRHREVARKKGLEAAMDPFRRQARGKPYAGVLDSTGGMAVADKACRFALHKARSLGARFVFGPEAGCFDSLCYRGDRVVGVKTRDGKTHPASMTIMACGGWTPVLLPQLDGLCEATVGSVALLKIPRASPLWDRLGPEKFPTWMWNMRAGAEGGLYGFPRTEEGWFKIGYRGTKYTNPLAQRDGKQRSTPATRWSPAHRDGREKVGDVLTSFPKQAHKVITGFLDEYLPELAAEGIKIDMTRLCWYTDTFDNHFVIDRVPGNTGLMVATGGSGHAFKYLPNIGNWVADVMEGVGMDRPAIRCWKWRTIGKDQPVNSLMEGSTGKRALQNIPLIKESELKHTAKAAL